MSYAEAASKGPKQSPEEARAPQLPQVTTESSSTSSIVNVDSQDVRQSASDTAGTAQQKAGEAKGKASEESETLKKKASDFADRAEKNFDKGKGQAKDKAKAAQQDVKGEYNEVYENRDNPVIIGNAVAITLGAAGLGYGAYTKHAKGELNWQVAGIAAAGVAVFGIADYYLSQYLFENKYPKRSGRKY